MPIGVMINCLTVLLGGFIGALLGERVPLKLRKTLPLIFGVASISMGIAPIVKMNSLPVVVLALILGSAVGELIGLENLIEKGIIKAKALIEKLFA